MRNHLIVVITACFVLAVPALADAAISRTTVTADHRPVGTSVTVRATTRPGTTATFTNRRNNAKLVCQSSAASGTAQVKTVDGPGPTPTVSLFSSEWFQCKLMGMFNLVVSQDGSWSFEAGVSSTTSAGNTAGALANVKVRAGGSGAPCTFVMSGTDSVGGRIKAGYQNSPSGKSRFTINGSGAATTELKVVDTIVAGGGTSCYGGAIQKGDPISFDADFDIDATQGGTSADPLNITAN